MLEELFFHGLLLDHFPAEVREQVQNILVRILKRAG
jgi:hypothetical protein